MKTLFVLAAACAAGACAAGAELTLAADIRQPPLGEIPATTLGFGYAADPEPGDEAAALACRKAGAWTFLTSKCDERTLTFMRQYGLHAVFALDGAATDVRAKLNRLADGGFAETVAGFLVRSAAVARLVKAKFPQKPLAASTSVKGVAGLTHVVVDVSAAADPLEKLRQLEAKLKGDKALSKVRIWVVASGKGRPLGKLAFLLDALASGRTEAVFFRQRPTADGFGSALRDLGSAMRYYPTLVRSESGDGLELESQALVLTEKNRKIACLVAVNPDDEPLTVTVDPTPAECNDRAVRWRLVFDEKQKGAAAREAIGYYITPKRPFAETLPPKSFEVVAFSVNSKVTK